MKIITGATGTNHVTSNNDGEFNQALWGDGLVVLKNGGQLKPTIVDNNNITIADGDLVFQGRHALIEPNTTENIVIDTGAMGTNRHDLIVAHYELDISTGYESLTLNVIKGIEASDPVDPQYTSGNIREGDLVAEAPLFRVVINDVTITSVDTLFEAKEFMINIIEKHEEEISSLNSKLLKHDLASGVSIINYKEASNPYIVPSDGYVSIQNTYNANNSVNVFALNSNNERICLIGDSTPTTANTCSNNISSIFVKKGMRIYVEGKLLQNAYFYSLG